MHYQRQNNKDASDRIYVTNVERLDIKPKTVVQSHLTHHDMEKGEVEISKQTISQTANNGPLEQEGNHQALHHEEFRPWKPKDYPLPTLNQ